MDPQMKKKLQRFLDATRGELFFARRILMVEGIAEALLLPVLARMAGGDLKKSAVTVVNADGLNFNCFLPLFGKDRITAPVAILTDGDAPKIGDPCSATAADLKAKDTEMPNLRVGIVRLTAEDGAGGLHAAYFSDGHLRLSVPSTLLPCRDQQSFRLANFRFALGFCDVEEMLAMRGVDLSYETVREWCLKFGQTYANGLRHKSPRPATGGTWMRFS